MFTRVRVHIRNSNRTMFESHEAVATDVHKSHNEEQSHVLVRDKIDDVLQFHSSLLRLEIQVWRQSVASGTGENV